MAGTGVLPFIRGIDLTQNDLQESFPEAVEAMTSLRWLRLTNTKLKTLPHELESLQKLEHLTVKKNSVGQLSDIDFSKLPCLRTLNLSRNDLTTNAVPISIFENDELNTLDLSHNRLTEVPEALFNAKSLLVLNLAHNQIETIPGQLLMATTDLLHFDVSNNDLDALPPQLRRLANLQVHDEKDIVMT